MALYKTKAAPSIFVVTPTAYCDRIAAFDRNKSRDFSVYAAELNDKIAKQQEKIDQLEANRAISVIKIDA